MKNLLTKMFSKFPKKSFDNYYIYFFYFLTLLKILNHERSKFFPVLFNFFFIKCQNFKYYENQVLNKKMFEILTYHCLN